MDFKKLEKTIDNYFSTVTDKQLKNDVERAGLVFYSKIKTVIFRHNDNQEIHQTKKSG